MHDPHHPVRDTNEPREPQASADPRRWRALAVLSMAQFMLILDLTVVNVALPDLGADLGLSRTAFTWTVSAYGLVFGGLLLLGGRLAVATGFYGVECNKALSVWASLGGVGFTAGVLIGGLLTSGPGWRWVFFIRSRSASSWWPPSGPWCHCAATRTVLPASMCWAR